MPLHAREEGNPVLDSAAFVYSKQDYVKLNDAGIERAACYIRNKIESESYAPWTWRQHPLHLCPPETYSPHDPRTRECLNWIFLVSALNFSFWSEREGRDDRYGVEWRTGWGMEERKVWTGYWSLLASLNKALESGIPITDPNFYSCKSRCPDELIREIFTAAPQCAEGMPVLEERILIMREVGGILCKHFDGSFENLIIKFRQNYEPGTAIRFAQLITETFPSFRDETIVEGRKVHFWKRPQILVAETWAAFHPQPDSGEDHPFFPLGVDELTMFADYRVPQILHHLRILSYSPQLTTLLTTLTPFESGSLEETSIRAASILSVEAVRNFILKSEKHPERWSASDETLSPKSVRINSVLIDFYLWDLAKKLEVGDDTTEGFETDEMLPAHRTRCTWY